MTSRSRSKVKVKVQRSKVKVQGHLKQAKVRNLQKNGKMLKKMPKFRHQCQGHLHVFPNKMTSKSRSKVKVKGQGELSKVKAIQNKQKCVICIFYENRRKKCQKLVFKVTPKVKVKVRLFITILSIFSQNQRNQAIS